MTNNENMPETHRQQIEQGLIDSLRRAGYAGDEITTNLLKVPHGDVVRDWLGENAAQKLTTGSVIVLETRTAGGREQLAAMGRSIHAKGIGTKIIELTSIVRSLDARRWDLLDELAAARVLLIGRFYETTGGEIASPFNGYQARQIEALILERIREARPTVLHVVNATKSDPAMSWWGDPFLFDIKPKVSRLVVGK